MKYGSEVIAITIAVVMSVIPYILAYYFNDELQVSKQFSNEFALSTFLTCLPLLIPMLFFRNWVASTLWGMGVVGISFQFFLLNMNWHLYKQPVKSANER